MRLDVEKTRITNATTEPDEHEEIEITPEMIEAGAEVISASARDVMDGWLNPDDVSRALLTRVLGPRGRIKSPLHDGIAPPSRVSVPAEVVRQLLDRE